MGLKHLLPLAALGATLAGTVTASSEAAKRQSTTAKYCPGATKVCFSEYTEPTSNIIYRVAIPDVSAAPFDILVQVVAPIKSATWAGIAWGGQMTGNPLTVAWPNGNGVVVSSRWSTGHTLPGAYAGASYAILPTTTTNSTHWQLDFLCTGCSQWQGGALDPNGVNSLAWAKSSRAVATPSSNTSSFGSHDGKGVFSHDLSVAKIPKDIFDALVSGVTSPSSSSSSAAPTTATEADTNTPTQTTISTRLTALPSSYNTPPAVVTTSVTQLPKPSSSSVRATTTKKPTTPSIVTVTVTAKPTTTTTSDDDGWGDWPPWTAGGGGGRGGGRGKGGGGWGRGKGGGRPPTEQRKRLAAPPEEW